MFPFQEFIKFAYNPNQYMASKGFNIPANMMNNPNSVIQYMMNSGMLSQQQYNSAVNQFNQLKRNPQFNQFYNNLNAPH